MLDPETELRDLEMRLPALRIQASTLNRTGTANEALTARRALQQAEDRYIALHTRLRPGQAPPAGPTVLDWLAEYGRFLFIAAVVLFLLGLLLFGH